MACGATCGITRVRERERQAALDAVERAYAGFVWRAEPARGTRGTHEVDAIVALGRTLEEILPVRALLRQGERGECDSIYLLAGVHTPSLFEVDRDATGRRERGAELHHHETYVRVGISPLGRFVTLQEVTMTASRIDDGSIAIEEDRLVGVEDKRLRHIVKGLQGALRKARWVVLDMAFLIQAPPEARARTRTRRSSASRRRCGRSSSSRRRPQRAESR